MPLPPVEPSADAPEPVHADPAHVSAVVATARAATPLAGRTVVISVDGRSGSGKTVLGAAVARELDCPLVHLDDLLDGWDGLARAVELVSEHVLAPLARGRRATYRQWDWVHSRPASMLFVDPTPHVVLEGCGALVPPALVYATVRIWVDAPTAVRRERALARDGDVYVPYWDRWAAQEDAVYTEARPREHAQLVLRTG